MRTDTVGTRIKNARNCLNLTQKQVADALSITPQLYYKYEHDLIKNIPFERIKRIAEVLDTTPAGVMGWYEPESLDQAGIFQVKIEEDRVEISLSEEGERFAGWIPILSQLSDTSLGELEKYAWQLMVAES